MNIIPAKERLILISILISDGQTKDVLTRAIHKETQCLHETMQQCDHKDSFQSAICQMAADQLAILQQLAEESGATRSLAH